MTQAAPEREAPTDPLTQADIERAEKLAYARGYYAAHRPKAEARRGERLIQEREEFRNRAFLAALPAVITDHGWMTADQKPISSLPERVALAWLFADEALKDRRV